MTDSAGKLALWSISDKEEVAFTSLPLLHSTESTPVAFDRYRNQVDVIGTDHVLDATTLKPRTAARARTR